MMFAEARLLIFSKPPIVGQTKTRLIPALGADGAAELHMKLTRHTLNTATKAKLCPVELWCAEQTDHPFFSQCSNDYPVTLKQQQGNDVGQRMAHALSETLKSSPYALLIGCDCPDLTRDDLSAALQLLKDGNDCVLGPADDGGYILIGLSRFNESIFQHIHWGTDRVLNKTRDQLDALGWQWRELRIHHDIDRPDDLQRLDSHFIDYPTHGQTPDTQ